MNELIIQLPSVFYFSSLQLTRENEQSRTMFASFNSPNETTLISTLTSTGTPLREKKVYNN